MADFETAITFVLANEGGFVDNPNDPGGATNRGLTLRFLQGLPDETKVKYGLGRLITVEYLQRMSLEQTKVIYKGEFWDVQPIEKIPSQQIANYVLDMCVNHGIAQGIKLLQRSIWSLHQKFGAVDDDGVLGNATILALGTGQALAFILPAERAGFMRLLAAIHSYDKGFLHGWLERCYRI
jgi:type VI secretion system secreted protein VgrG